jgi:hypothetical protein
MKLIILCVLIFNIAFSAINDCNNYARVLELGGNSYQVGPITVRSTDCRDKQVCFISCSRFFNNSADCSKKEYGLELPFDRSTYRKACQLGYSESDPLYNYLRRQLRFKGNLISDTSKKTRSEKLHSGYVILRNYLAEMRKYEWCQNDEEYKKRQDELLKGIDKKKKKKFEIVRQDEEFEKFILNQKLELLQRNRKLIKENGNKCDCMNVVRYLKSRKRKVDQLNQFVKLMKGFCPAEKKTCKNCNSPICDLNNKGENKDEKKEKKGKKEKKETKETKKTKDSNSKKTKESKKNKRNKKNKRIKKIQIKTNYYCNQQ